MLRIICDPYLYWDIFLSFIHGIIGHIYLLILMPLTSIVCNGFYIVINLSRFNDTTKNMEEVADKLVAFSNVQKAYRKFKNVKIEEQNIIGKCRLWVKSPRVLFLQNICGTSADGAMFVLWLIHCFIHNSHQSVELVTKIIIPRIRKKSISLLEWYTLVKYNDRKYQFINGDASEMLDGIPDISVLTEDIYTRLR